MGVTSTERRSLSSVKAKQRPRRRWLWYVALVLVLVVGLAGAGSYAFARRSLPQIAGELRLAGLNGPVTVYRDDWGVPHIEATSSHDLYMAQGYITAQDRLWQMELNRRAAAGRLSEVLGESQLESDKFLRTLMLRRSAELSVQAYSPWAREALEAYSAGVSAYIQQATEQNRLPVEFTILGFKPEPWQPVDSASIGKLMAFDLGRGFVDDVWRQQAREALGDDLFKQILPFYPNDGLTIMKYGTGSSAEEAAPRQVAELPPATHVDLDGLPVALMQPAPDGIGSNNWVVSGKQTKSGKPILSNDPHLGLSTPAIWYQTHLMLNNPSDRMNVIGVIFPGTPGIVIGHNEKVAWGVTNVGPDVFDTFIEKRNPQNPNQFEFMGKWEDATVHKESIKVKGKPDVPFEVVVTRHGPIISEIVGSKENRPKEALALKWTAHMATPELEAVLLFGKASNWSEFREALRRFQVPMQNFVFASVDGTIAYRSGGIAPVRAKGDGLMPVPGWTGEYEWKEFIPFERMPEVVNPPEGMIVTANHKVIDDAYPFYLGSQWSQPYRAGRITEMLKAKAGSLTVDDMRQIQADNTNLRARSLLPAILPVLEKASLSETEKGALALLKAWDFVDDAEAGAPLIFATWRRQIGKDLFEPKLGKDLYSRMPQESNITDEMLLQAAKGNPSEWVKLAGGLEMLLAGSFKTAVADVVKLQGNNPQKWNWGKFHQIGPAHAIGGAVKPLGWFLNAEAHPIGGSSVTPSAMSYDSKTGKVTSAGPWRQVVDLANPVGNSWDVVLPGQSGHFLSKWYTDQAQLHWRGELHPQLMDASGYRKGSKLVLQP